MPARRRHCANPKCRRFLRDKRRTIRDPDTHKRITYKPQQVYCSRPCRGIATRGTGKSHIRIRVNGKRKYLHRHIIEQLLGRELTDQEIVHHLDEMKHHNDPSNLELLSEDARREHLKRHNYHRHKRNRVAPVAPEKDEAFWF